MLEKPTLTHFKGATLHNIIERERGFFSQAKKEGVILIRAGVILITLSLAGATSFSGGESPKDPNRDKYLGQRQTG